MVETCEVITLGMSSVSGIVKNYFVTLRNQRTGKANIGAIVVQLGVPIVVGIFWAIVGPMTDSLGNIIVGVSIVSALLCSMATILFQIRIDLRARENSGSNSFVTSKDLKLVDELFSVVLWAILFGLLFVLFMVIVEWFDIFDTAEDIEKCVSGCIVACVTHFAFVIGMVLKRLSRVYDIVAREKR